jgi:co-chaperonin GroES (HSP10)
MQARPGYAILDIEEKKTEGTLILPDNAQSELQRGTIVSIGATYWKDGVKITDEAKIGDRVIYAKYHETPFEVDGKNYKVVPLEKISVTL